MFLCIIVEIIVSALVNVVGVKSLAVDSFTDILVGGLIDFSNVLSLCITKFKASVIFLTLFSLSLSSFLFSLIIFVCYCSFVFCRCFYFLSIVRY